ncbi:hypothetical protein SS50377_23826 [Spironucleus salmonicida]|uniref:Uncharacterized protein n=1 Tax=Spironucleus salmonicida TaxID=348837 RepID=V6LPH3_9EUKA|nr:hypothetical protein SS50377_23826 [Spironucleus salmonicida]|eukprot:EST46505.1 Hypothetical protein SS50377_13586 [Spironucleus salmonicida]
MEFSDDFVSLLNDIKHDKPLALDYLFDPDIQNSPDSESFEDFVNALRNPPQIDSPSLLKHEIDILSNFHEQNLPLRESSITEHISSPKYESLKANHFSTVLKLNKPVKLDQPSISEINISLQPAQPSQIVYKPQKPAQNLILKRFLAQSELYQNANLPTVQFSNSLIKSNFLKLQKFAAQIFILNKKIDPKSTIFGDILKKEMGRQNEFQIEIQNRIGAEIDCKKCATIIIDIGNQVFGKNGEKWTERKRKTFQIDNIVQQFIKKESIKEWKQEIKVKPDLKIDGVKKLDSEIQKLQKEIEQIEIEHQKQLSKRSQSKEKLVKKNYNSMKMSIAPDKFYFSDVEISARRVRFSEEVEIISQ